MLAVRGARLFDGVNPTVLARPLVLVDDGRITAVEGHSGDAPPGAEVVDLGDVTLLPGLVDSHVHLGFDGGLDPVGQMPPGPPGPPGPPAGA